MKQTKFYQLFVLAGVLLTVLACDNEVPNQNGFSLVKSPDFVAYSGEQTLGSTFSKTNRWKAADVNGNLWYQTWDRPTNITEEERAKVIEEFSKVRVGAVNDIHIDWNNYWVQQVYTGETTYTDGYNSNIGTGSSHMNQLLAYSGKYKKQTSWYPTEEFELLDKESWQEKYEHVNNFNYGNNTTVYTDDETQEQYFGTTLMTDMYADGIIDQFGYSNTTDSKIHYEYIILEIDGDYYIGFDFYATHPDGQDANKNMDVERDWVFNDWIVKISPAYLKGMTPEQPEEEQPEQPNDDTEEPIEGYDEVEINLSVNDYKDYTATKLSMHLRSATDIEVFIPIPAEYYCQADDMAIVQQHLEDFMIHGGPDKLTYNINGYDVTLYVNYEVNGIRVHTEGMCQEILDYCIEHFQDGLTFEVWNYFNNTVDRDFINEFLKANHATVEFLDKTPGKYINAFAEEEGDRFYYDNYVDIVAEQQDAFTDPQTGKHLNDSHFNEIYTNKGE